MNSLEIIGFVFGVAGVWLTIREHWTCFPVGLVNVTVSLFLFLEQKLYSNTLQQAVYIVLLSYGWYAWKNHSQSIKPAISYMGGRMKTILLLVFITLSFTMGFLFDTYTDADVPYFDASATAMSFIAQYLIARKKIENWLIWMVVNVVYVGIYAYKELYLYAALFTIYLLLAIKGYWSWKAAIKKNNNTQGRSGAVRRYKS